MRFLVLTTAATLLLGGTLLAAPLAASTAYGGPTCAGRPVTIDLNRSGAPDPDRPAADVVLGTSIRDVISTGGGDDVVCGGDGWDLIDVGAGNDIAQGNRGTDQLEGGPGTDQLRGGAEGRYGGGDYVAYTRSPVGVHVDLRITSPQRTGAGQDWITGVESVLGSANDDVLRGGDVGGSANGGAGDDRVTGGAGNDYLRGGAGNDVVRGGRGVDNVSGGDIGNPLGADDVYGGDGDDALHRADDGDRYYGGDGKDAFFVESCETCEHGVVELSGGRGRDKFYASARDEAIDGGPGSDLVLYSDVALGSIGVTVDLAITAPQDTVTGGIDTLLDIERLEGTRRGDDHLSGNSAANKLYGLEGSDVLVGRGGADLLAGGYEGADICRGGPGEDVFYDCETTD